MGGSQLVHKSTRCNSLGLRLGLRLVLASGSAIPEVHNSGFLRLVLTIQLTLLPILTLILTLTLTSNLNSISPNCDPNQKPEMAALQNGGHPEWRPLPRIAKGLELGLGLSLGL